MIARKSKFFCDYCKTQGHTVDRCFKLHGYPNNSSNSGNPNAGRYGQRGKKYAANVQIDGSAEMLEILMIITGF